MRSRLGSRTAGCVVGLILIVSFAARAAHAVTVHASEPNNVYLPLVVSHITVNSSPVSASNDWPMFLHDPSHSARSPVNGPQSPTVKWHVPIGRQPLSSPVVGPDGTVYVEDGVGVLYAVDPLSGSVKWTFAVANSQVSSTPAVGGDGTIYVGMLGDASSNGSV